MCAAKTFFWLLKLPESAVWQIHLLAHQLLNLFDMRSSISMKSMIAILTSIPLIGINNLVFGGEVGDPKIISISTSNKAVVAWRCDVKRGGGTPSVTDDSVVVGAGEIVDTEKIGSVYCFSRRDGSLEWVKDYPRSGQTMNDIVNPINCRPVSDGSRVFFQTNVGEIVAAKLKPSHKNNQLESAWSINLEKEYQIFRRDALDVGNPIPSPLLFDKKLYCITGNGSKFGYPTILPKLPFVPKPDAPSFIAIDAITGKLLWSNSKPGKDIIFGQWASPALIQVEGTTAVLFPGGDGYLYALDAINGKQLGRVDLNKASSRNWTCEDRGDRMFCIHRPLVVGNEIFLGLNQDAETFGGLRPPILCLNGSELLKGSPKDKVVKWEYRSSEFTGVYGDIGVVGNNLFAISCTGWLVCIDRRNGLLNWSISHDDAGATAFVGVTTHNNRIFVPVANRVLVYEAAKHPKLIAIYHFDNCNPKGSCVVTEKELYVTAGSYLWCIKRTD